MLAYVTYFNYRAKRKTASPSVAAKTDASPRKLDFQKKYTYYLFKTLTSDEDNPGSQWHRNVIVKKSEKSEKSRDDFSIIYC